MNDQELVKAVNQLTNAIRGGTLVIVGAILSHAALITHRPENGILGLIPTYIGVAGGVFCLWMGAKIMYP
ncbi:MULTISPECIES: hypothetical protein [Nostoc]|uniref:Uncharacterized protein n=2 Tax=Nostoc TaxID=1177 RepID=A0ABR8I7E7_9NOSO|nr:MULTISPECIES: hypothetical protein [Nostoc]MBD2561325.1 hypothetical protein [Nostoc linckia FACHB-391]MBD2646465.1 hypothetical protein [Nostoc foliaceum FACHB-393]